MNKSGCKDPTAEKAISRLERENKRIRKCPHVESIGTRAIYVTPNCPNYMIVKGRMVSYRSQCLKCRG